MTNLGQFHKNAAVGSGQLGKFCYSSPPRYCRSNEADEPHLTASLATLLKINDGSLNQGVIETVSKNACKAEAGWVVFALFKLTGRPRIRVF